MDDVWGSLYQSDSESLPDSDHLSALAPTTSDVLKEGPLPKRPRLDEVRTHLSWLRQLQHIVETEGLQPNSTPLEPWRIDTLCSGLGTPTMVLQVVYLTVSRTQD